MPDLGDIAQALVVPVRLRTAAFWNLGGYRTMEPAAAWYQVRRDDAVGDPQPSLRVGCLALWQTRLAVPSGARTLSARVYQPQATAARPALRLLGNPAIGIASDASVSAGAGTGWQTVSINFTATASGGIVVRLENPDGSRPCWWDNLSVT